MNNRYVQSLRFLAARKWITVLALVVFSGITFLLFQSTPSGFIPNEDRGIIMGDLTLPPGTTLEKTQQAVMELDSIIASMDIVEARMSVVGFSLLNSVNGGSYAFTIIRLKDWKDRKGDDQSVEAVVGQLFAKTAHFKDAKALFFTPPSVSGFGSADGFELKIQDKGDDDWQTVSKVTNEFLGELMKRPEIQYAITNFNPNFPQYEMDIKVERAKNAGVSINDIFNTMQGYYGGLYTTDFNKFGKQYRVMIQAKPSDRENLESINNIYVKNASGQQVAISQFIDFKRIYGPEAVARFNMLKAVNVNGKAKPGFSSGDAIKAIQEVAAEHLPKSYSYEFSGMTREEIIAGSQAAWVFLLSLIFVYFLLSAQYESYLVPLAVLLSLPVGLAGAIGFVNLAGLDNNIYFQVALIMLIGLLAKNAILIVEFAIQRRRNGMPLVQSAIEGAQARLRPILMTSLAFIFGLLPLALASGVGAVGNRSIGMGAVGGMLVGTVIGVFFIPILFVIFQGLQERISGKPIVETTPESNLLNEENEK